MDGGNKITIERTQGGQGTKISLDANNITIEKQGSSTINVADGGITIQKPNGGGKMFVGANSCKMELGDKGVGISNTKVWMAFGGQVYQLDAQGGNITADLLQLN